RFGGNFGVQHGQFLQHHSGEMRAGPGAKILCSDVLAADLAQVRVDVGRVYGVPTSLFVEVLLTGGWLRASSQASRARRAALLASPTPAKQANAAVVPNQSAPQPARLVLAVAPSPIARPIKPRDRLKWPDRAVTSLVTSGTITPKHVAAIPSSAWTKTTATGFVTSANRRPRKGSMEKPRSRTSRLPRA